MTGALVLREPLGERLLHEADFPLSIGGAGSDLVVPGHEGTLAWIALHDGQLFLQPAGSTAPVLHNGVRLTASTWLRNGDVIDAADGRLKFRTDAGDRLLEVVAGGGDNATAPPVAEAATSIANPAGDEEAPIEPIAFGPPGEAAPTRDARGSRRRLAIGLALVALAALAALLFTSVPVQVDVTPQPERLAFEGGLPGLRLGSSFLLRPGTYTLVAEKEGYRPLSVPVEVTRERNPRRVFELAPLPGRLEIVLPVPGRVTIDGREAGSAPGVFELAAGRHAVAIDTERYLDYSETVDVAGLGRLQKLEPKLVPAWAVVRIASEPGEAEVRVAGEVRGRTPLELELMAGSHRVELRREGYKTWVSDVQVRANEPFTLGPVQLGLPDGRLAVRSSPSGASVSVGGAFRGRTPLEVDVRPDLAQSVAVNREGYEPATREVTVGPGGREVLEFALAPILGDVIVQAQPADAQLYVDGAARGGASQTLQLPATAHVLEIRKPGYATHRTTVTPRPGLPQRIEVTLLTSYAKETVPAAAAGTAGAAATTAGAAPTAAPVAAGGALAATITSKAGQPLKLAPAGEFTMGSPRREAGRRANEAQRRVRLERRFYVSLKEVTNADFKSFRPAHRSGFVLQETLERDRQPVVNVTWQDAAAYCNWLSEQEGLPPAYVAQGGRLVPVAPATTGYRLPTEAEWEWVARRSGGGGLLKYPWGDALPVPTGSGNFADRRAQPLVPQVLADLDDGHAVTAPVGSFAANALGYFDLGGNVAEWAHDLYTVQPPAGDVAIDPVALGAGALRVIRGSSWQHSAVTELRLAFRDYGDGKRNDLGFRIARYAQ